MNEHFWQLMGGNSLHTSTSEARGSAREFGIRYHGLPQGEDDSFFLCKELREGYLTGITGEYATPQGYFVDEKEAEEFDKQFPPKEKLVLPGQLF